MTDERPVWQIPDNEGKLQDVVIRRIATNPKLAKQFGEQMMLPRQVVDDMVARARYSNLWNENVRFIKRQLDAKLFTANYPDVPVVLPLYRRTGAYGDIRELGRGPTSSQSGRGKKPNPWLAHVNKVRKTHPKLSYKQALVKAKQSYKK